MKKVFDQTVRDIKRGVNKKVLKVPSIEQKILDATSNESWGPHGTHLADIAQASRNYHDYQMIMSVVWKRLNDTGKNWRHVFKGLTVLEYLVINGSERVIEDIREHAYQITTLSSFQYIDSTGRDQGSNIRKKSQILVALVNDKQKIQEEREKAAANRDKLRNTSGGPQDDRNGYGREREWGDDKYGRYSEDQYGRDGYKDDEYRGRSRSNDGDNGTRSQGSDREKERGYEEDSHHSSRGSNARVEDSSPDGSRLESKSSGQNLGAPPSYEDVVSEDHTPDDTSPPAPNHQEPADASNFVAPPPPAATTPLSVDATPPPEAATAAVTSFLENDGFDFFDPRGATPAAAPASGGAEMDLLGSLSDAFSSNALALVPSEPHPLTNTNPSPTPFDDPFGDGPFKAVPSTDGFSAQPQPSPFSEAPPMMGNSMGFGDAFDPLNDILADILPPPGPSSVLPSQTVTLAQPGEHSTQNDFNSQFNPFSQTDFLEQSDQSTFSSGFPDQFGQAISQPGISAEGGQSVSPPDLPAANGGQSELKPGFPAANGGQSMLPSGFPAAQGGQTGFLTVQGGQSVLPSSFPAANGSQSNIPMAQGGQPGFPSANGSQPGFPAAHGGQPDFPIAQGGQTGFAAANGSQPGLPAAQGGQTSFAVANGGQTGFSAALGGQTGFTAANGSQPGLPVAHGGQTGFPMANGSQPGLPVANGSQSSFPMAHGGQTGFAAANGSQPGLPVAHGGQTGFPMAQGGQTGFPVASGSQPGFPASNGNQPGFPTAQSGQPGFLTAQGGQPGFPAVQGGQPSFMAAQGSQPGFPASQGSQSGFTAVKVEQSVLQAGFPAVQGGQSALPPSFGGVQNASLNGFSSQFGTVSQSGYPNNSNGQPSQPNNLFGGFQPQGSSAPVPTLSQVNVTPAPQYNASNFYQPPAVTPSTGALALVPQQPTKEKFETKSTVWSDTLNRGLVNLNISGSKTNPLSDIGIDFEAINRKEKRMEKPSKTPVTSNVTMGKAMGSGSGIGRAGATALRPAQNQMMGMGVHQPMGMNNMPPQHMGMNNMPQNMGMNNMPQNMGMGMNTGHGFQMQQQQPPVAGFPPGNYNPMAGRGGGGYGQQPYGGYR